MVFAHDHAGLERVSPELSRSLQSLDDAAASRYGVAKIPVIARAGGWQPPLEGSERYRMLNAALAFRGAPYRFKGERGGHDAWSLVRQCASYAAERDCIDIPREVPGFSGVTEQAARVALTQWGLTEVKPRHAEPGDVVLFQVPDEPLIGGGMGDKVPGGIHIGILSAAGGEFSWAMYPGKSRTAAMMVHAYPARAICESHLAALWERRVIGAFSFDSDAKARPFKLEAA